MRNIVDYVTEDGLSPFERWFARLNVTAAAKVAVALYRLEQGNLSNTKSVGKGVFGYRIHFGPGYRVYFGQDGETLVILLAGGTKKRQNQDIQQAQRRWADYPQRKNQPS
jgi:putative addiction module killer protein